MSWLLSILSSLIGSKVGRIIGVLGLTAIIVFISLTRARKSGVDAEKAKQAQATLDALRKRIAVDDTVARMPRADRRSELERWMRDGNAT